MHNFAPVCKIFAVILLLNESLLFETKFVFYSHYLEKYVTNEKKFLSR